jgi:hypothetical protein
MQRVQPSCGRNDTHEPDYHGFYIFETGIRDDEGRELTTACRRSV